MSDAWPRVLDEIRSFQAEVRGVRVSPSTTRGELRSELRSRYDLQAPIPLDALVADVTRLMRTHAVHVVHPRYFGLFNPSVRNAGIIGDTLTALYNPQLAVWSHAPAAQELERLVLARFAKALGMDPDASVSHFATGGAESNLTAVLAALASRYPRTATEGLGGLAARPVIYLSDESHHSFVKIARMTGLGTDALRRVRVDQRFTMDVDDLKDRVQADLSSGCHPLIIVGTAGTTSTGAVDPLRRLGAFARNAGIWLHVDAAWGGSAVLSDELRPILDGIEMADSVTWDAHKWLSVPMGAGMLFCRHREAVHRAFSVTTSYMPEATDEEPDPYQATAQWSRRAIGLKVFLSVAELGVPGYARIIEHQALMAELLRSRLRETGWTVVNDTRLPVVCFTHPEFDDRKARLERVLTTLRERGRVWISSVAPSGSGPLLRACITSFRTAPEDIECLMEELGEALEA